MAKYRLKFDKNTCQGNFICTAVDPDHFEEDDDGKAKLIGASEAGEGVWTLEIDESEKRSATEAANSCPVLAITLIDAESEEAIAP